MARAPTSRPKCTKAWPGTAADGGGPRPLLCPLAQALAERRRWDLVVFDPPKLAPSRKALDKATRKYRRLNAMAMQVRAVAGVAPL